MSPNCSAGNRVRVNARIRNTAGTFVFRAALKALARKRTFFSAKVVEFADVVFQVISFDVANAMTLHREAAKQAASERRSALKSLKALGIAEEETQRRVAYTG